MKSALTALVAALVSLTTAASSYAADPTVDETVEFDLTVLPVLVVNGYPSTQTIPQSTLSGTTDGTFTGTTTMSSFLWIVDSNADVRVTIGGRNPLGYPDFGTYGPVAVRQELDNGTPNGRWDRLATRYHPYVNSASTVVVTAEDSIVGPTSSAATFVTDKSDRVIGHNGEFMLYLDCEVDNVQAADAGLYKSFLHVTFTALPGV